MSRLAAIFAIVSTGTVELAELDTLAAVAQKLGIPAWKLLGRAHV